jgi:hypothetical protein
MLVGWHSRNNLSQKGVEAWQILDQQAKRASSLMRGERVHFASLLAGGGDVLHQLPFFVAGAGPEQEAALDRIFDVVRRVARELADAQPGVSTPVLVTYPDYAHSPLIRFMLSGTADPEVAADHLAANIASFDRRVRDLAAREGYPLVDLWELVEGIKREGLVIHGIALERDPYFVPKGIESLQRTLLSEVRVRFEKAGGRISEPPRSRMIESAALTQLRGIFTVDGIHLSPILHALWCNELLEALGARAGTEQPLPPLLTPKEMLTLTGLDPQQDPVADAGPGYRTAPGASLQLDASASTDPNPGDVAGLRYAWDLNGDSVFGDADGVSPTLPWSRLTALGIQEGEFRVRVRVSDEYGGDAISPEALLRVVAP